MLQEEDPIRTGYSQVMRWIGERVAPGSAVLDLGSGTGNTIAALPPGCTVTGVDISSRMTAIARNKLAYRSGCFRSLRFVADDILSFAGRERLGDFDVVTSAYTLHHLLPSEREALFELLYRKAGNSTLLCFGDLMYVDAGHRLQLVEHYRHAYPAVAAAFEEEFFWDVRESDAVLASVGWSAVWKRHSDLSWTVRLNKSRPQ